jgi:hypothetical protein
VIKEFNMLLGSQDTRMSINKKGNPMSLIENK